MRKSKGVKPPEKIRKRRPPGMTLEARENQLINYAATLAEKQLRDGTASSQVMTHYLKLGSTKEKLEKEKLEQENKLLKAKTAALESAKRVEELYAHALAAMRTYAGQTEILSTEEEDD